jgi:2-haloacid dehalogenase
MKYTQILFDLDDTILDFQSCKKRSLAALFSHFGFPAKPQYLARFEQINSAMWHDYEVTAKNNDILSMRNTRFSRTMNDFGITVDGTEWELEYQKLLAQGGEAMPHAPEVLARLHSSCRLFVISNGIDWIQQSRLANAGFSNLFEKCFISTSIGAQKPTRAFFDQVASSIPGFCPSSALVVGDRVLTDIKGGLDYGLACCWYNSRSESCLDSVIPTFTISDLSDLVPIVTGASL